MNISLEIIKEFLNITVENKAVDLLLLVAWKIILILLTFLVAKILVSIGSCIVRKVVEKSKKVNKTGSKKIENLQTILTSTIKYLVYIIAVLSIFTNILGILDIQSVLATVGVGGVAIGFGAQSLIKDIISGFFILIEGQMNVGDSVTAGDITGTVKELDLRCVKLVTAAGETVYVPYGEISKLKNTSKENSTISVEIPLDYNQDINVVIKSVAKICKEYSNKSIVGELSILDPISLNESSYAIKIIGKAKPGEHWAIERELRKIVIETFKKENIKLGATKDISVTNNK